MKIDLVCLMENIPNVHPVLADVVMEAAFRAIDSLMTHRQVWHIKVEGIECWG